MVFHPPRALGLLLGVAALVVLLAVDAALLGRLRADPLSPSGFLSVCFLLASLPVLALVGYRTYALLRSRYVLSRNALVVEWGGRRLVLPLRLIEEAGPAAEFPGQLRPRVMFWPGNIAGRATIDGLGPVEFLAATEKAGMVLVKHPEGWLALSPAEPSAFLAALARFEEEGPDEAVEPEAVVPAFARWELWHDWLALGLISVGAVSVLLLLGYLVLIAPQLPEQIALHFNALGKPDRFGPPGGLLILPIIAGLAWLVNTLAGAWLHRYPQERAATYVLLGATLFVQALVWVATIGLLTAGNAA